VGGIGRLDLARARFQHMLDFDLADGQYSNVADLRTRLAESRTVVRRLAAARRHAIAAAEAGMETGAARPRWRWAVALVDAYEGHLERAQTAATDGIERTEGGEAAR